MRIISFIFKSGNETCFKGKNYKGLTYATAFAKASSNTVVFKGWLHCTQATSEGLFRENRVYSVTSKTQIEGKQYRKRIRVGGRKRNRASAVLNPQAWERMNALGIQGWLNRFQYSLIKGLCLDPLFFMWLSLILTPLPLCYIHWCLHRTFQTANILLTGEVHSTP